MIQRFHFLTIVFFILVLICGLIIYKDYGIAWDEPIQRRYGLEVYNFIHKKDSKLLKSKEKYYGPVIEYSLILIEKSLSLSDFRNVFLIRHLAGFIIFWLSGIAFFFLVQELTASSKLALLGGLMYFVSPRLFAHSFFNTKDLPLMSIFVICFLFNIKYLKEKRRIYLILLGIFTGILISVRIIGILMILISFTGILLNQNKLQKKIIASTVLMLTTVLTTYITWPTLWNNPVDNFKNAYEQMSKYPQKTSMWSFGNKVSSTNLPWHYSLGWVAVTTPVSYLILFGIGCIASLKSKNIKVYLVYIWALAPIVTVIYLKSNLYDSWRQLFFIYPGILLISILGLQYLLNRGKLIKYTALSIITLDIFLTLWFMILNHPFQNVYFNFLAGPKNSIHQNFELDYWGTSYKQALEKIEQNFKGQKVKVSVKNYPGENNILFINNPNIELVNIVQDSNFYLTNYRGDNKREFENYKKWGSVMVNEMELNGIYLINEVSK